MQFLSTVHSSKNGIPAFKRLLLTAAPYWPLFLVGIIGTLILSGADAGLTWLLKPVINIGFVARNQEFIRWLPIGMVAIFLLRGIAGFLSDYCITRVGRNAVRDLRQKMFTHLLKLPATFYDKNSSGQLLSALIFNVEQVANATSDALVMIIQEGSLTLGFLIVMFVNSWQLSLLFFTSLPVMLLIFRVSSRRMRRQSSKVQDTMAETTHIAEESIEGYKVIRTFGGEQYEIDKFNRATNANRSREMKVIVTDSLGTTMVQMLAAIYIAILLYLATSLHLTAGSFVSMIGATFALLRPLRRLTTVNNKIQKGIAGAQSIFELLDREPENDTGNVSLARAQGKIVYYAVTFRYPATGKTVLEKINFSIQPGETIALVGKSGSGKSTLVNLLPRFYEITAGNIYIDNTDIRQYRLADLRNQFALVSQHVTLFNDTIANNIAYGRFSEVTQQEIMHAAEAAHAMEFIKHLPNGFNTLIGDNGVLLSGGQRQRIALARAILKNTPILILDEATSSLDTESERHIQIALEELMRERTTLVIAHRLSTIEKATRIVVMDQGQIVEIGTHQELLQLRGYYAKLHSLQFKDEAPAAVVA